MRICASGDMMLLSAPPTDYDYLGGYQGIISSCDGSITNLESTFTNWDCNASTFCGGQWISSDIENLEYVKQFGFNLYGCANNHSMDYSFDGLRETMDALNKRSMTFAGIGQSLDKASSAGVIESNGIRISLISVTCTTIHNDASRAGNGMGSIPPRGGVNYLRTKTYYNVTRNHMAVLKEIAKETYINGERNNARKIGSLPPQEDDTFNFGGILFKEATEEGKVTKCDQRDLSRILTVVATERRKTDYVVVQIHSHQIKNDKYYEPDYYHEEFAHKCIDNGACAVIGGGTHQLKPVELYKGKPIFYSLGNFCFQDEKIRKMPYDFWDKYNYDLKLPLDKCKQIKTKNGTIGLVTDKNNYVSFIPVMEFEGGVLKKLTLMPITLGFESDEAHKGLPVFANRSDTMAIYNKIKNISKVYGTQFTIADTNEIEVILDAK